MDQTAALQAFEQALLLQGEKIIARIKYATMAGDEDVRDAFHTVVCHIYGKMRAGKWKTEVRDWYRYLYGATKNEFLKELKFREEKLVAIGDLHPSEGDDFDVNPDFDNPRVSDLSPTQERFPTAESVAINRERLRMIQETMPTLSSGEQQTLLLELEGLSHKEAADRLETTLGTIRYWRCIGIKKLASLLRAA